MYGYIYKTTNKINNKIYIGQHKSKSFDPNYYGSGKLIKIAVSKYGKENFEVKLLDKANDAKTLSDLEIKYISLYNSAKSENGYNMSDGGPVPRLSGKNNGNYGHKWTDDMRKKLSDKKKRENLSPDTIYKMSKARKGKYLSKENNKAHAVVKLSKDNKYIAEYPTIRDAAKDLEIEIKNSTWNKIEYNICATCRGRQHTCYGYIWRYKEDYEKMVRV